MSDESPSRAPRGTSGQEGLADPQRGPCSWGSSSKAARGTVPGAAIHVGHGDGAQSEKGVVTRTLRATGEPSTCPRSQRFSPPDPESALSLTSPTRQGMKVTLNPIDQTS